MLELRLIGIGTGNPEHITLQGQRALREADVVLIPRKGGEKGDLAELRRQIIGAACPEGKQTLEFDLPVRDENIPYLERVERWHDAIAEVWAATIARAPGAQSAAMLVWGDPSLYDSTLRIAGRLAGQLRVRVVPGITSLQALTAAHRITLNSVGAPVTITTGRQLRDHGWPEGAETLAVMLDAGGAYEVLEGADFDIYWGAFLGMENEVLCAGQLSDVADEIARLRAEGREAHGWIMDTYLLRKRAAE